MEQPIRDIELDALDISLGDISDAQLARLISSDELQDDVQACLDLRQAIAQERQLVDVEAELERMHRRLQQPAASPRRHKGLLIWSAVAAAAVFIGALLFIGRQPETPSTDGFFSPTAIQKGIRLTAENGSQATLSPQSKQNTSISLDDFRRMFDDEAHIRHLTLTVPFGKSADITLPDSSKVYLSPGTQLTFPSAFADGKRVVKLEGNAYFKVKHDSRRPFIVIADKLQTTVLGTEFNIDTRRHEVTLITGSVRVKAGQTGHEQTLRPNQQVTLGTSDQLSLTSVDPTPYTMWRDGYLYFDNVDLETIMQAIGANFNKTVEFRSHTALHYKMRFISERNNGVSAALDMMNRMQKVNVRLDGNKIIVEDL